MKNLILTSLFFAIGFTSYSQNDNSLLQEETKKIIILKNVNNKNTVTINKTSITTEVLLKQPQLKSDLKYVKTEISFIKDSSFNWSKYQSKAFFRKFYGRKVILLS